MQFHKPQRQPIAAVSPSVTHVTGKAMHQVDSEIADFRLLERLCHRIGGGNIPERSPIAILRRSSLPPMIGDSILKAKLNC